MVGVWVGDTVVDPDQDRFVKLGVLRFRHDVDDSVLVLLADVFYSDLVDLVDRVMEDRLLGVHLGRPLSLELRFRAGVSRTLYLLFLLRRRLVICPVGWVNVRF